MLDRESTELDRQGPCPEGYHIPSTLEWKKLTTAWAASYGMVCNPPHSPSEGTEGRCYWEDMMTGAMNTKDKVRLQFQQDLLFPMAGYRHYTSDVAYQEQAVNYRSSTPFFSNDRRAHVLGFAFNAVIPQ